MKIVFTGDNHIFFGDQRKAVLDMMKDIHNEKPDIVCNIGDIGEILTFEYDTVKGHILLQELFSITPTLYVPGNHDLYSKRKMEPPEALHSFLKYMPYGIPLQTSWEDSITSYQQDNCLFLGTMGFPDFSHPKLIMPLEYYNLGCPTIDGTYMNLRDGWLKYTKPLIDAFEKKLQLIDKSNSKNIVILTHYSIFESQYKLSYIDEVSPYFYCHKLGELVSNVAKNNPTKNFYCVSGHGHEYNIGQWIQQDNIYAHGLVTTYHDQKYITLEV